MPLISRLLIANRGEIAVRIMRTAKRMGITTIAIYSDADKNALHVKNADEAYYVGKSPSISSYLKIDRIIEICLTHDIDAIHPGYGFLSENALFAKAVRDAGIAFIGPSPEVIELMGDKLQAKQAVRAFDVPLLPGLSQAIENVEEAKQKAAEIGFPILIKAAAGGGGKGMRTVFNVEDFEDQMERAVSEAQNAFGNGAVFIEKFITSPRHIEIQVLADQNGNCVHLFERECSIQRRHQKVIEEAPSSVLTPDLREKMGQAAIKVCKACQYTNAGTVEFLLDEDMNFYFLEMNTRLQVEHPVTELITGLDLVKEQIYIAEGKSLSFSQEELSIKGHAIETRIYAENPRSNFLPDTGTLHIYRPPLGKGIRLDGGYVEGEEIPIFYDPMIAKLITYAENREAAIRKMDKALSSFAISGVETTAPFGRFVMQHPAFISGKFDTQFIKIHYDPDKLFEPLSELEALVVGLVAKEVLNRVKKKNTLQLKEKIRPINSWRMNRIK